MILQKHLHAGNVGTIIVNDIGDRLQISLLISRKLKGIHNFSTPLKPLEKLWLSEDFRGEQKLIY